MVYPFPFVTVLYHKENKMSSKISIYFLDSQNINLILKNGFRFWVSELQNEFQFSVSAIKKLLYIKI